MLGLPFNKRRKTRRRKNKEEEKQNKKEKQHKQRKKGPSKPQTPGLGHGDVRVKILAQLSHRVLQGHAQGDEAQRGVVADLERPGSKPRGLLKRPEEELENGKPPKKTQRPIWIADCDRFLSIHFTPKSINSA